MAIPNHISLTTPIKQALEVQLGKIIDGWINYSDKNVYSISGEYAFKIRKHYDMPIYNSSSVANPNDLFVVNYDENNYLMFSLAQPKVRIYLGKYIYIIPKEFTRKDIHVAYKNDAETHEYYTGVKYLNRNTFDDIKVNKKIYTKEELPPTAKIIAKYLDKYKVVNPKGELIFSRGGDKNSVYKTFETAVADNDPYIGNLYFERGDNQYIKIEESHNKNKNMKINVGKLKGILREQIVKHGGSPIIENTEKGKTMTLTVGDLKNRLQEAIKKQKALTENREITLSKDRMIRLIESVVERVKKSKDNKIKGFSFLNQLSNKYRLNERIQSGIKSIVKESIVAENVLPHAKRLRNFVTETCGKQHKKIYNELAEEIGFPLDEEMCEGCDMNEQSPFFSGERGYEEWGNQQDKWERNRGFYDDDDDDDDDDEYVGYDDDELLDDDYDYDEYSQPYSDESIYDYSDEDINAFNKKDVVGNEWADDYQDPIDDYADDYPMSGDDDYTDYESQPDFDRPDDDYESFDSSEIDDKLKIYDEYLNGY